MKTSVQEQCAPVLKRMKKQDKFNRWSHYHRARKYVRKLSQDSNMDGAWQKYLRRYGHYIGLCEMPRISRKVTIHHHNVSFKDLDGLFKRPVCIFDES